MNPFTKVKKFYSTSNIKTPIILYFFGTQAFKNHEKVVVVIPKYNLSSD